MNDDSKADFQMPAQIQANEDDYDDVHFLDNISGDAQQYLNDQFDLPAPQSPGKPNKVKFQAGGSSSQHSGSQSSGSNRNNTINPEKAFKKHNTIYDDNKYELAPNVQKVMDIYQMYQTQNYQKQVERSQKQLKQQQDKINNLVRKQKFIDKAVKVNMKGENNLDHY